MTRFQNRTKITYRLHTGIYVLRQDIPTTDRAHVEAHIVALMAWGADPASITVTHY